MKIVVSGCDRPFSGLTALMHGFQSELARYGYPVVFPPRHPVMRAAGRVISKLNVMRPVLATTDTYCFTVIGWCSDYNAWPYGYTYNIIPWIYDCWEPGLSRCESLLLRHKVKLAFFSSKDVCRIISNKFPNIHAVWSPEACDPALFRPFKPLTERQHHVYELGRSHAKYHEAIKNVISTHGYTHNYPANELKIRKNCTNVDGLYSRLGDAMVIPCFPKCITHPGLAGKVCTMTQRYLEAMGSGCLILGQSPNELIDLFGFDPVIPVNWQNPGKQLINILKSISSYQEHVDRCRARLLEVGTFAARVQQIHEEMLSLDMDVENMPT